MTKKFITYIYNWIMCTIKKIIIKNGKKTDVYIGWRTKIVGKISIGKNSVIGKNCYLGSYGQKSRFSIGERVNIGMFCQMACATEIKIENDVLFGPNVYIADYNHEYRDIKIPISMQGLKKNDKGVFIKSGAWIGKNVVIVGNVTIGKNSVIGANSFVNKDIPDYCVAVGTPCKIVKKYNFNTNQWEKTI